MTINDKKLVEKDFNSIYNTIKQDAGKNNNFHKSNYYNNLFYLSDVNEVLIRNHSDDYLNELVLARIKIHHRKQGIASSIINELIKLAKENNLHKVVIESIMSPEMKKLALDLGFMPDDSFIRNTNGYGINYYYIIRK